MPSSPYFRLLRPILLLGLAIALLRYGLPLVLPFLIGILLALAAEPAVRFLCNRLSIKRSAAAFWGVSLTLILLSALGLLLFSGLFHAMRWLASIMPELVSAAQQGLTTLQDRLLSLALSAPDGIREFLTKTVLGIFDSGGSLYAQAMSALPGLVAGIVSHVTGGFVGIGTAVLSAFLISHRLRKLKQWLRAKLPERWQQHYRPAFANLRQAAGGWLNAQARLMGLTFCILLAGFLLLWVPYAPVWAFLIALLDAVPMLGTGLVLIPWSIIHFLRQEPVQGTGLMALFLAATLTRSTLEPRLVGQQLGLDPLVTLICLYLGYQLLGLPGLLLAPLLGVTAMQVFRTSNEDQN